MMISVIGTVGIPAAYGGFETLAENLARFHKKQGLSGRFVVYCSTSAYPIQVHACEGAELRYINLNANGVSSILYDVLSMLSAIRHRTNVILLLGVSGAIALPLIRLISRVHIVTNIDGLEWKRAKWSRLARWFLRLSERLAVRYSHYLITDNVGIAEHVKISYGRESYVIAYGGDHAVTVPTKPYVGPPVPSQYAFALCRIEPENNVAMILEAFAGQDSLHIVFVGNWNNSDYGRNLHQQFAGLPNIHLLDPIYDVGVLRTLREQAALYVHGHSAGGTNPSLVEMMHFGIPILAYDCIYNRYSTDGIAVFFGDTAQLIKQIQELTPLHAAKIGFELKKLAQHRYTWDAVGKAYLDLLYINQKDEINK